MYPTHVPRKPVPVEPRPGRRRKWWVTAGVLMLLLVVWQGWRMVSSGRALARAKDLQSKMADANLPAEQRQQLFQDLRGTMQSLTPDQRQVLFVEQQNRQEQEYDRYFAMNAAEQRHYLDERINRMQQRTKAGNGKGPGGAPGLPQGVWQGGGKGWSGGKMSPDEIEKRKKQSLDRSSPDFRAKSDRFRKDMDQRMKQRNIAPPSGGPGGRR